MSRRGRIHATARVTDRVPLKTVFIPFHNAEAVVNKLISGEVLDQIAKIPDYKVCAVKVEKAA